MKKLFVILVALMAQGILLKAISQNGYNVLYKATMPEYGGKVENFTRVVFNNYLAYVYNFSYGAKDPLEDKGNYGSKPTPHTTMIRRSSSDRFYYYGLKGFKNYWALDTTPIKVPDWVFTNETKSILGYTCRKAYWLNEYLVPLRDSVKVWRVDSTIVWYAQDIKSGFAIFNFPGLPGLPLEISDKIRKWNYKALWIKKEDIFIDEPRNVMPIEKLRKKR